jgi:hypothetical protein
LGFVLQLDANDEVDDSDIREAVTRVVQRHPALLVHVSSDGTSQVQPSVSNWKATLSRATEIRHLPGLESLESEEDATVTAVDHPMVAAACSEALDITSDAPLRFYRAGKKALLLVVHHVLCDASSLSILAQQLNASHKAIRAARLSGGGSVNNLAQQPRIEAEFGFFVHAAAQAQQSTADLVEKIDHWEELLTGGAATDSSTGGGFRRLHLRHDYPPRRPGSGSNASASSASPAAASAKRPCASIEFDIPPALVAMIRSGAGLKGRTAFSILISAWALTLRQQAENRTGGSDRPVDDLVLGAAFDLRGRGNTREKRRAVLSPATAGLRDLT